MIKEKVTIKDGLTLEIVDGEDIILSYKNNKLVDSCMSRSNRWKYAKLYKYVKDLTLLRIMKGNDLALRTLLWHVKDEENKPIKFADVVYHKKRTIINECGCEERYCDDCCEPDYVYKNNCPSAYEQFKELWPKYADVRRTNKRVFAEVLPNKIKIWPYMDTLQYYNPVKRLLSNNYTGDSNWKYYTSVPGIKYALDRGPIDY